MGSLSSRAKSRDLHVKLRNSMCRSFATLRTTKRAGTAILLLCFASSLQAQAPRPAGPRTIIGIVTDTSDVMPVDSAQISITALQRRTTSALDGSFRFNDIKPGTYRITARRLGYQPQEKTVVVTDSGGVTRFSLVPISHALPTVVTSATQLGLSGVIGDTAYNILDGAEIQAVDGRHRTVTDSTGKFYLFLKPGQYMIRVSKEGYGTKLMAVTIPRDSGRRIVSWLAPADKGLNNRLTMALLDMNMRRDTANANRSKLFSHEDIDRLKLNDLQDVATVGAGHPVADICDAIIDGGPTKMPLWFFTAQELELVEVYLTRPKLGGVRPPRRNTMMSSLDATCGDVTVYAWLRH